jgi:hypothetical protein
MTDQEEDFERVVRLLHRLPEKQYARYRLGLCLHLSLQQAALSNTEADKAYVREVASRIYEVTSPEGRELFSRWLEPGGALRLWE